MLRFDGHLATPPQVALRDPAGASTELTITMQNCQEIGLSQGDCVWLHWSQALIPQSLYTLSFTGDLFDATGAALTLPSLAFETADHEDDTRPRR